MAIDKKYLDEAKQMLTGGFENQRVQLNNSFNQHVQSLEGQKGGVNQNFDNQLAQNAINTTRSKNQYNNNTLSRGLGRSTVATSGQAGIQDSGNRISNQVEEQRNTALSNIEAQKTMLQQALQENLLGLTYKQDAEMMTLAQQLEQQAYDRAFQREQFEWQKAQALRSGSGGSSGGGGSRPSGSRPSGGENWDSLLADYRNTGDAYIVQALSRIKDSDPSTYKVYMTAYRAEQERRRKMYEKRGIGTTSHVTKTGGNYQIR